MYEFDGFTTLGEIDLSTPSSDELRTQIVLMHNASRWLFRLDAYGCACCGISDDDMNIDEATRVEPDTLVRELLADINKLDNREDAEYAMEQAREMVAMVIDRVGDFFGVLQIPA